MVAILALAACSEARELSAPCEDCTARVHPRGILDEQSDAFHAKELARRDWDFELCASCHGEDFRGNQQTGAGDCTSCHSEGPTACVTCHGDGPTTGAHAPHLTASLACAECHTTPTRWDDDGHIVGDAAPAEVTFGPRAGQAPAFADGTCSNVYCHGATLDAGGVKTQPRWDEPAAPSCGNCHGAPPPSHAQSACVSCHPASAPHIDGVTQIGRTSGCDGCHGSATNPAPPTDLAGNQFTNALGVGAHQAHLVVPSGLRAPIPCETCHVVPTTITSAGHIDTALPAEVMASLGWDRTSATCGTASCHGPARPIWTETGGAACGTCHGIPPATASHTPTMPLSSCVNCHPPAYEQHINGVVDVR